MNSETGREDPVVEEAEAVEACGVSADVQHAFLYSITGQTPWWIVSVLLHSLVITLAGLATMTMELPEQDQYESQVTVIGKPNVLAPVEQPKRDPAAVLEPSNPAMPVCLDGTKDIPPLTITPEMLQNAIFGDHIEVPAPDGVDGGSVAGDPNSRVLLPTQSAFDKDGGGGDQGERLMEDMIGIGSPSPGRGGGWGGGDGEGIGDGKGDGKKGWGYPNRKPSKRLMLTRIYNPAGTPHPASEIDNTVRLALGWLVRHQEYDGHWDAVKYGASVKTDTAVTGLALLTFLGAGHTERIGEYQDNVRRAVAWLKSKQAADGSIWDTTDDGAHHRKIGYPCAIATLAMAEAAGMGNIPDTKASAQKAIDYCAQTHQSGEGYERGGWRYAAKEPGDLSVSGWFIMALKSAKVSGLKVPASAFDGAIKFLDSVEIKDNSAGGYGSASRYKYTPADEHASSGHRLTAIGNLARQFLGWKKEELQPSVEGFINKGGVPSYGANGEHTDLYYWYYGTMCVFQQGGDLFKRWNEGMKAALIPNQCKQGDVAGSWNPVGEFSTEWGRVGQTSLSALCIEVYWRYDVLKTL